MLFPVSIALDFVALAAVVLSPILGVASLIRAGWQRGRSSISYLGYACCAILVASFAVHFILDGGDIYMMFVFWLIPFSIAGALALLITLAIGRNGILWMLALATIVLSVVQAIADRQPGGIGGGLATMMLVIYGAYALFVLGMCACHHDQWRRGWDSNPRT